MLGNNCWFCCWSCSSLIGNNDLTEGNLHEFIVGEGGWRKTSIDGDELFIFFLQQQQKRGKKRKFYNKEKEKRSTRNKNVNQIYQIKHSF